jgi:hypothetical protein
VRSKIDVPQHLPALKYSIYSLPGPVTPIVVPPRIFLVILNKLVDLHASSGQLRLSKGGVGDLLVILLLSPLAILLSGGRYAVLRTCAINNVGSKRAAMRTGRKRATESTCRLLRRTAHRCLSDLD